jgi:hypothetical protein
LDRSSFSQQYGHTDHEELITGLWFSQLKTDYQITKADAIAVCISVKFGTNRYNVHRMRRLNICSYFRGFEALADFCEGPPEIRGYHHVIKVK